MKDKVVLSWSGGKDSAMALYALLQSDRYEIVSLLTTVSKQYERISHHGVRLELLEQQAAALGIPLHKLYLTCVDSEKLGREFAGRPIDADLIRDLPDGVDPCGENGTRLLQPKPLSRDIPMKKGPIPNRYRPRIYTSIVLTAILLNRQKLLKVQPDIAGYHRST